MTYKVQKVWKKPGHMQDKEISKNKYWTNPGYDFFFLVSTHKIESLFKFMAMEKWPFPFSAQLGRAISCYQ